MKSKYLKKKTVIKFEFYGFISSKKYNQIEINCVHQTRQTLYTL